MKNIIHESMEFGFKEKISIVIGIVVGIVLDTILAHEEFVRNGCSVSNQGYFVIGLLSLICLFGFVFVGWSITLCSFYILETIKGRLTKSKRDAARERRRIRKETLGFKYIDPDTKKRIITFGLYIVGIITFILVSSALLGYIWWLAFC